MSPSIKPKISLHYFLHHSLLGHGDHFGQNRLRGDVGTFQHQEMQVACPGAVGMIIMWEEEDSAEKGEEGSPREEVHADLDIHPQPFEEKAVKKSDLATRKQLGI